VDELVVGVVVGVVVLGSGVEVVVVLPDVVAGRIDSESTLALSTSPVKEMVTDPELTETGKVSWSAVSGAVWARMSKFESTVVPLMATLNTRCPSKDQ
jgi:hypothetical protein